VTVARITQLPVEVLGAGTPKARLTQLPVEVLGVGLPAARLTTITSQVLSTSTAISARVTQQAIQVLSKNDTAVSTRRQMTIVSSS
jgi:hypothetical protein